MSDAESQYMLQIKPDGKLLYLGGLRLQTVTNEGKLTNEANLKTLFGSID